MLKKILLISFGWFFYCCSYAQTSNKLYFLADTVNTPKINRVLRIEKINAFEYSFIFFCKCAPPYKSYVSFSYVKKKNEPKTEIFSKKPDYPYISFKELMDITGKNHRFLNDTYDVYITEVLPGKKYRTNKVVFNFFVEPIIDSVTLKEEKN